MKKNVILLVVGIVVSLCFTQKVCAQNVSSFSFEIDETKMGSTSLYDIGIDGGAGTYWQGGSSNANVQYIKLIVTESGNVKFMPTYVYGNDYNMTIMANTSFDLTGNRKHIVVFKPSSMSECPPETTTCVTVSSSKAYASTTYVAEQAKYVGMKFEKKSLFGSLKLKGTAYLYYL